MKNVDKFNNLYVALITFSKPDSVTLSSARYSFLSSSLNSDNSLSICAEVYPYEAIHELWNEIKVKEAGKIRTEGKGYYPKDGDIMFFRFNVKK